MIVKLPWGGKLLQRPFPHQKDLVRHGHRLLLIMGHKNGRNADLLLNSPDLCLHFRTDLPVQSRQRLIQQKDIRLYDQCSCQCHSLLLPSGQLRHLPVHHSLQTDQCNVFLHLLPDLISGNLSYL